jgi:crotonobetainyl-CoA:carnitine CoA-transferase CaiB-like acyl-CoA transferase
MPDPIGGAMAAFALVVALRDRDNTGHGVHIDLSQRETATLMVGDALVEYSLTGEPPKRLGNHEPGSVPSECYPCAGDDRWIAIVVQNDEDWTRLCRAMGRRDLERDPRFETIVGRRRSRIELDQLIGEWTSRFEHRQLMAILQQWGVTAGAVLNPRELFVDPHLRHRGFWETVEDYSAGTQQYTGRPMRFSMTPPQNHLPTPQLGQHNEEILTRILGLDVTEIKALQEQGVIGSEPVLSASGGMAKAAG